MGARLTTRSARLPSTTWPATRRRYITEIGGLAGGSYGPARDRHFAQDAIRRTESDSTSSFARRALRAVPQPQGRRRFHRDRRRRGFLLPLREADGERQGTLEAAG